MVAVLKKPKGQCTTPEKMLQFRVKIIAVACCVVELGRLKKEDSRKMGIQPVQVCRFGKLGIATVNSLHKHRQAGF